MSAPEPVLLVARPNTAEGTEAVPELSIVVPAYNEADRLPGLLQDLATRVDPAATEIIVVDDGSTDGTADVAVRAGSWCPNLTTIAHPVNQGKGAAVRTGVAAASGAVIAFFDADNATDLGALEQMKTRFGPRVGAVVGSRHASGSVVVGAPPIRGVMGRVFNHLVRAVAGASISDTQCGAKMFRRAVGKVAFSSASVDGFAFDVEVLRRIEAMGMAVVEQPVHWTYVPGTKIKLTTPVKMVAEIIKLRARPGGIELTHVDGVYSADLAAVTEPLGDRTGVVGEPCRVLIPDGLDSAATSIAMQLGATPTRSRLF